MLARGSGSGFAYCGSQSAGKLMATVVPPPGVSESLRSPPWAFAMVLHAAKPRPVPAPSPSRRSRTSGSRTFARSLRAMPLPLSADQDRGAVAVGDSSNADVKLPVGVAVVHRIGQQVLQPSAQLPPVGVDHQVLHVHQVLAGDAKVLHGFSGRSPERHALGLEGAVDQGVAQDIFEYSQHPVPGRVNILQGGSRLWNLLDSWVVLQAVPDSPASWLAGCLAPAKDGFFIKRVSMGLNHAAHHQRGCLQLVAGNKQIFSVARY